MAIPSSCKHSVRIFDPHNRPVGVSIIQSTTYDTLVQQLFASQTSFISGRDVVRIRLRPKQTLNDVLKAMSKGVNPCEQTPQLRIVSADGGIITSRVPFHMLDELYNEIWRIGDGVPDNGTKEVRLFGPITLDILLAILKRQPTARDPLERLQPGCLPVTAIMKPGDRCST